MFRLPNQSARKLLLASALCLCSAWSQTAAAAATDLSDYPLVSASSDQVKPNILYVLDDSGSMRLNFMPDGLNTRTDRIGIRNSKCNLVYYNPSITYIIPKTSTNSDLNSSSQTSFTAAYADGYFNFTGSGSSTIDLSTSFKAFTDSGGTSWDINVNDATQAAYYWSYLGSTTLVPLAGDCEKTLTAYNDTTTKEYCTDNTRTTTTCAAAGKTALWRKITVSSTSGPSATDERQNFANWYSYYRTRLNMMKSASGRAFVTMSDAYRIGFITINPNNPVTSDKFLTVADFDTTQKPLWFTKLYSQTINGGTPLREALSRAGRYYAGKTDRINNGMSGDPVQYSCQQNFTILTTDGYWNGNGGEKMDGTTDMDNQDGVISELDAYRPAGSKYAMSPRPIFDGASQTYTWHTASNQYQVASCVYSAQEQQRSVQYQSCTNPWLYWTQTKASSGSSWSAWSRVASCTTVSSGYPRRNCRNYEETQTSSNSGSTWSAWTEWTDMSNYCAVDSSGSSRRNCRSAINTCLGTWTNANCTNTTASTMPLCQSVPGSWSNTGSCTAVAQDASGVATECQNIDIINGYKKQYLSTKTDTVYAGPGGPGQSQILSGPFPTTATTWLDIPPGTCYATSPTLPADGPVTGSGPPDPPASCTSGSQVWPCETYSSGGSGVSANISSLSVSGSADPYTVTATTSTNHTFFVGHSVNITGVTSDYGGYREIIAVPASNQFQYYVSTHPGVSDGTGTATLSSGSSNSLADVAQYYYKTDLRTSALGNCTGALGGSISVCDNNVPSSGSNVEDDRANWQHMTTFTMGLGLTGTVNYSPTYKIDGSTVVTWPAVNGQITGRLDFQDIRAGTANWPIAVEDSATALDDLWHAAVNGRGQYFSASNPDTVITSLSNALAGISARVASSAAAATSNLEPVAGDNFAYTPKYVTQKWTGEIESYELDLATGKVTGSPVWSAQTKLDALTKSACDNRTIKLFHSGAANNLVDFKWNTYACDSSGAPTGSAVTTLDSTEQNYFGSSQVALLSQYANMSTGTSPSTVNQRGLAAGANMVNFIRGQRGKEGFSSGPPITSDDVNKLYRARDHVLGDIVNAQPVYVKAPGSEYTDAGYTTYRTAYASRTPMLYVAANDGMLHALYAGTSLMDTQGGVEAWAFMPTMVLPNLYKLASEQYATEHVYFVDGTPTVADVFDKTTNTDCALSTPASPELCWKTILVAGLNKGGNGYYALDITNPATPKALWEFKNNGTCISVNATTKVPNADSYSDCQIGYTYSNPVIGKLADGTWVAFVTSGHNNVNSPADTGNGEGYLYVLNAITGKILYRIGTGAGSTTTPSGLNHINAWVNNALFDNTITRIYGGDLLGNIWRFDVNDSILPAGREATLLAQVVDSGGTPQPISTKVQVAEVLGSPYVYAGTGKLLGVTDKATTGTQTIWAIKDTLSSTAVTNLRTNLGERTINNIGSGSSAYRTVTASSCVPGNGWYADLPDTGERVNVDMDLQQGTLIAGTNVPENNACSIGGYSWLMYFNYKTGCSVATSANGSVGTKLVSSSGTQSLVVGITTIRLPGGKTVVIANPSEGTPITLEAAFDTGAPTGKRISWREIIQ